MNLPYPEHRKPAKILLLQTYVIFFGNGTLSGCEHFSILRCLNWFFRNWQFNYMSLIVPTGLLSSRECYLISFAPFCVAWYCQYLVLIGWMSGMIVNERSSIILMKQMSHEMNVILKNMKKWKHGYSQRKRAFPVEAPLFFEGHKPLPWENQSNLCTGNGSLDKSHSNSLALSNRRMILNSESATKCCQINCVAVSMFYILFLWGWIKSRLPRNDFFSETT